MTGSAGQFASRRFRRSGWLHLTLSAVLAVAVAPTAARAQETTTPSGSVSGRVVDETSRPLEGAQVYIIELGRETRTGAEGTYRLTRIPVGSHVLHARLVGYKSQAATVTIAADQSATQDFQLVRDPLNLSAVVVTGTVAPRSNLESSVALTTLSPEVIEQSQPRSTTEMLRYVPGFTRIESSGGEVNQNISMRGILGVEYVMFMEDGLPVFPTMHTFFMNADNLFRPDENIATMEVVRGGASSLFGSNTPGAIINFINKTGGSDFAGTTRLTAGTEGLYRYDLNLNGPLGESWRFNVGGFYRYDHGVRDPGFPGIRGGQVKANLTRLLPNGYLRFSGKVIDDRNQFILPLPFTNPGDPQYVPGLSKYASMNTNEGLDLRVPTPEGTLQLPLGDGLRTSASWFTVDAQFDLSNGYTLQNTAQVMRNAQAWNAILPFNVFDAASYITAPANQGGLGLPAGTTYTYTYTNQFTDVCNPSCAHAPFSDANNLVAPSGEWHVEKPLTAFQNQLQLRKAFGNNAISGGLYLANYSQGNRWYFTDILMNVRDNPNFLDLVVVTPGATPVAQRTINVTKNGFRHYISNYANGDGTSTIVSGVLGADLELTPRLRSTIGGRWEWDNFVQNSENTTTIDPDGNTVNTPYNNEAWGNGSFRHFNRSLDDWAASVGLNFSITPTLAVYASGSRGYKMPALDEYLNASSQEQVALFDSRTVQSTEAGVKYAVGNVGITVNGFYTLLKNITSQGNVVGSDGRTEWIITSSPDNRSYGAELEAIIAPVTGLQIRGSGTLLKAELGKGAAADVNRRLNGVPASIGNLSATWNTGSIRLLGDWHYVAKRYADVNAGVSLPAYNYANFGVGYTLPGANSATIDVNLLNAFQSYGFEEGNPRVAPAAGAQVFLARPILPRRLTTSIRYNF